jgi:hypothetical protein
MNRDSYQDFTEPWPESPNEEEQEEIQNNLLDNNLELKMNVTITMLETKFNTLFEENKEIKESIKQLEKTILSLNEKLISQNIKLSDSLVSKVDKPEEKKDMFYKIDESNNIFISGPGTFGNKYILKTYSDWDPSAKSWKLTCSLKKIKEIFPDIKELKKEKIEEKTEYKEKQISKKCLIND